MKISVTGGTGNVGAGAVNEPQKPGAKVRVRARELPEEGKPSAGVEIGIGDLREPGSFANQFDRSFTR